MRTGRFPPADLAMTDVIRVNDVFNILTEFIEAGKSSQQAWDYLLELLMKHHNGNAASVCEALGTAIEAMPEKTRIEHGL